MTDKLPDLQARMVDRVVARLQGDRRFDALLGGGSLVHGGFDRHSDLDFIVVVRPADHAAVMTERRAIAADLGSLLAAFTGEHVGEPRLLICLFGPPLLHVDLKFLVATDLDEQVERPVVLWARAPDDIERRLDLARVSWPRRSAQWFEDRAWLWLHYGATKLARGEYFEAIGTLDFFREQVLGPLLQRNAGQPMRGVRRIEQVTDARDRLLPTLARYDRASIVQTLTQAAILYVELRQAEPPPALTPRMPEALLDFIAGS